MWAERILELQRQLVQARQVTERLCLNLEAPGAKDRWIQLGGEDPDTEVLEARVAALEGRVNAAREELLERELVLEEAASLSARLRAAAAAASGGSAATAGAGAGSSGATTPGGPRPRAPIAGSLSAAVDADNPGLAAAKQASELQARIREVNRRMMAVVSELSMYQATAIKLAAESAAAGEALAKAEDAATKGLPPSVTAEQRWQSVLKAMQQASGTAAVKP
jgi:hypothetical protein